LGVARGLLSPRRLSDRECGDDGGQNSAGQSRAATCVHADACPRRRRMTDPARTPAGARAEYHDSSNGIERQGRTA